MISAERKKKEWVEFCIFSANVVYYNGQELQTEF